MRPLAHLNHFFWKYRKLFIPGLLAAAVSAAFSIAVPVIVRQAVDTIPRFVALHAMFDGTPVYSWHPLAARISAPLGPA